MKQLTLLLASQNQVSHPFAVTSLSGAHLEQSHGYFGCVHCGVVSHSWGVFFTNIPLCDSFPGVKQSKDYNPLLWVSADGKVRKISPCFCTDNLAKPISPPHTPMQWYDYGMATITA